MDKNMSFLLIASLLTFLFTLPPTHALAQGTVIDRLNKILDVKLSNDYETKVKEFLDTCFWNVKSKDNNTVRDIKTRMQNFTEQFVVEQMKEDWGINRQNQLLFIWAEITDQIVGDGIYDGEDGDNKRLQEYEKAIDNIVACGEKYKNGMIPLIKEISADAQQRSADAQQQTIDKGLEALTGIITGFEKYITLFQNMINLDGATQTPADYNQEKNTLKARAEKLRSELQTNQHPSEFDAENLKKTGEQLLSDLTNQRTAVAKQIYAVIEKNIPEIEKRISSSAQKIEEAKLNVAEAKQHITKAFQEIDKAKQKLADAQKFIADHAIKSAEDKLTSTMNLLICAEYDRQIAANKQQIAETEERLKKGEEYLKEIKERNKMTKDRIMRLDSIGIKNMAEIYIVYTSNSDIIDDGVLNIDRMKALAIIFVEDCKKYRINYKDILMKEVKTRVGLDDVKARRKVDEMLKFYDVE